MEENIARPSTAGISFVVFGLVGGVGAGKSTLARWVAERLPVVMIDGDRLGHEALCQEQIKQQIVQRFGQEILDASGQIIRPRLGELVWGNQKEQVEARKDLEKIVHPVIRQAIQAQLAEARKAGAKGAFLDAAVMIESNMHGICDELIFVDTPHQKRLEQVRESRGWSEEHWQQRERSQFDLNVKRGTTQFCVDNSGTIAAAGEQLLKYLQNRYPHLFPNQSENSEVSQKKSF